MRSNGEHREAVERRIAAWCDELPRNGLYDPMAYLMKLPAKRVRPVAVLLGNELFGGNPDNALDEALGIELFHAFTLMHDDIMDASPTRRGDPSVHAKWDVNTAILSGDAMLVKAYMLMGRDPHVRVLFNRYALEVCEGQQMDMDFEKRADVKLAEYREMIRLKTAVLLSCAMQVGAILANAPNEGREAIGQFGERLGLAFQLRDDVLDAFGDPAVTGKTRGGDLRNGKKTALLIRGLELEKAQGTNALRGELARPPEEREVARMIEALEQMGVRSEAEQEIAKYEGEAIKALDGIAVAESSKEPLRDLAAALMDRKS